MTTQAIVVITNIPAPYRIPLLNLLADKLREHHLQLVVIFGAATYKRREYWQPDWQACDFDYYVLGKRSIPYRNRDKSSFYYWGLNKLLRQISPVAVIGNGFSLATTQLWLRSFWHCTPYLIWSGETPRRGEQISLVRKWQRQQLIQRASGFICYGQQAREYLLSLGAKPDDCTIAINTTVTDEYAKKTELCRWRNQQPPHALLYIGNLVFPKRVDTLLAILQKLRENFQLTPKLIIVGDGPQRAQLEHLSSQHQISEQVTFVGAQPPEKIPYYLAQAKLLLFPSQYDIWGMVLVEAMAAGVPCLVQTQVGAAPDLIENNQTGWLTDFEKISQTAELVKQLWQSPKQLGKVGSKAAEFIHNHVRLENSVVGFMEAILRVTRES